MLRDQAEPVIVDAPARFAVLAPGAPTPKVIVASGDQISDLVGFYSLREAGLENVVRPRRDLSASINPFFSAFSSDVIDNYLTFDIWMRDNEEDSRERLYSLIIHNPGFSRSAIRAIGNIHDPLSAQLQRIVNAYVRSDRDELTYVGQMIATFVSYLVDRLNYEGKRLQLRRRLVTSLATTYLAAIGIIGLLLGLVAAVRDSQGKTLLDAWFG